MRGFFSALGVASTLFLSSCGHGMSAVPSTDAALKPVAFETIYSGLHCGVLAKEASLRLISDQKDLEEIYGKLNNHIIGLDRPGRPWPPAIDFTQSAVVAVYMGLKPTLGYSLEAEGAKTGDGALEIKLRWTEPAPDAIVGQALTSPCIIIKTRAGGYGSVRAVDGNNLTRATLEEKGI